MLKIKVENRLGEILDFSQHTEYSVIVDDGLTPPTADVVSTAVSTRDGSRFNYTRLQDRNIVMTVFPSGNIEKSRVYLYKWFSSKQYVKLYFTTNSRDVFIEGYVESMTGSLYENPQSFQISIICPFPYFRGIELNQQEANYTVQLFEFPFSIESEGIEISTYDQTQTLNIFNDSDSETGITLKLYAADIVVNPKIYKRDTLEYFGLNIEMKQGDLIEISTGKGSKNILLHRDGETYNIINTMMSGVTWLQLDPGDNAFTFEASDGIIFLSASFEFYTIYEGV